jgi:hypothetical protein
MIEKPSIGRRRNTTKLTAEDSVKAVSFIKLHASKKPFPVTYAARMLGCSYRTAWRILSSRVPYTAKIRKAYVVAYAFNTGAPYEHIVRPFDLDYSAAIVGWLDVTIASQATKTAALLGAGIATRSMTAHNMVADFSVLHSYDGRPASVVVLVKASPGVAHQLRISEMSDVGGLVLTHTGPKSDMRCQVRPTETFIDNILRSIKNETHKSKPS